MGTLNLKHILHTLLQIFAIKKSFSCLKTKTQIMANLFVPPDRSAYMYIVIILTADCIFHSHPKHVIVVLKRFSISLR